MYKKLSESNPPSLVTFEQLMMAETQLTSHSHQPPKSKNHLIKNKKKGSKYVAIT